MTRPEATGRPAPRNALPLPPPWSAADFANHSWPIRPAVCHIALKAARSAFILLRRGSQTRQSLLTTRHSPKDARRKGLARAAGEGLRAGRIWARFGAFWKWPRPICRARAVFQPWAFRRWQGCGKGYYQRQREPVDAPMRL
jgi:hypothetical protein